jgi:acetyltransferase-like isoleucine patch superfamily enzyme
VRIGAYSRILCTAHFSKVGKGFIIGDYSSCGEFCIFGAAGGITIGKNVMIGQYVSFHAQDHLYDDPDVPIKDQGTREQGIVIGDDCWIGAKATFLDGAKIGNHCVVAAGAVVKGVFPDNVVIGGIPAKIIKTIGVT